jgi:ABC-2 type transport system ATP-binding protein
VLVSTHLLHDVEAVCDSVALLRAGKLILSGNLKTLKRRPGGMYELRVKESIPGRFANALSAQGAVVGENQYGLLRVTLDDPDTRLLFETARKIGAELRYLRRFEPSLEEMFLNTVEPRKGD